jgi:acylphosphatase
MPAQRLRHYFRGRVQGVGFRYTAHRIAADYEVCGYVRNLPDGRVELVAEGEPAEIDRFVNAVQEALGSHIHQVERAVETPGFEPLAGFQVRF